MSSDRRDNVKGRFISFEGGEGTGKSTQTHRLAERLRAEGHAVTVTREPGGTPGAEIVRRAVIDGRARALGPLAEAVLMNAARDDHLNEVIRPALAEGRWVICDRFADSTRAYQGALGGLDDRLVDALARAVVDGTWPDLTVILDLDPEIGLARAQQTTLAASGLAQDRFEAESLDQHRVLREAFLSIAAAAPERCVIVDASGSEDAIAEAVWDHVSARLLKGIPAGAEDAN